MSERAMCDCCQERPWKYQRWACGIETYVCWVCAGEIEEEQDES
jgi:hypothetical protein